VIERIFSIVKACFNITEQPPRYPMTVQVRIPPALCAMHNFILRHDPDDNVDEEEDEEEGEEGEEGEGDEEEEVDLCLLGNLGIGAITHDIQVRASKNRDHIASEMWKDYTAWLAANNM
jgi:hypothetical protein